MDFLKADRIKEFLNPDLRGRIVLNIIEKTASTNDLVKEYARNDEKEGFCVIAGEQSAGRGRLGRTFFSPGDTGVYLSILLKPCIQPDQAVMITTAAAVAVCRALEHSGVSDAAIKWVNDVYINSKKVCGILTEASYNTRNNKLDYVVLGVGINIYEPEAGFPDELKNIAGAVFSERGEDVRNSFTAYFLNEFFEFYDKIDEKPHVTEYINRNLVVGKAVAVIQGDSRKNAVVTGINDDCELEIIYDNGEKSILNSGEISVRVL